MSITLDKRDRVAVMTIDRPPVNALDTTTWRRLDACLDDVASDESIRCMVLAAEGNRAFSAGADIKEFPAFMVAGGGRDMALLIHAVQNRLEALARISIAAVEAPALGGGCELILACDLRVAGHSATFGFPEVTVGQFPGTGGTMRLPWLIGEARARELLLTGRIVEAEEAERIGLIHRLVPEGEALSAALDWAEQLSRLPASGIAAVKASIVEGRIGDLATQSDRDSDLSESVFQSREAEEGYRAFVEKRLPNFDPAPKEH